MMKVGVTGGIGSGKTTVCKIFQALGIPVYYADIQAKLLMTEDQELRKQLLRLLGAKTYLPGGQLNRSYVARRVFANKDLLSRLNGLVHPAVARDSEAWAARHMDAPYTIQEAALHYESGGYRRTDLMIVVTAPEALRIQRVMKRDGITEEEVRARMANQWPEADKVEKADYLVHNDGEQSLVRQVLHIHRTILAKARTVDQEK